VKKAGEVGNPSANQLISQFFDKWQRLKPYLAYFAPLPKK
jgi:hypothetical protein